MDLVVVTVRRRRSGTVSITLGLLMMAAVGGVSISGAPEVTAKGAPAQAFGSRATTSWDDTYVVVGEITVSGDEPNPASLAISEDDTVYVANSYEGTVESIVPGRVAGRTDGRVTVSGPAGVDTGLFGIAVDPSDDTVYVVDRHAIDVPKNLWAIDGRSLAIKETVALPCSAAYGSYAAYRFITVSPAGDVYVPCSPLGMAPGSPGGVVSVLGAALDDSTAYFSDPTEYPDGFYVGGIAVNNTDDTIYLGGWDATTPVWSEVQQLSAALQWQDRLSISRSGATDPQWLYPQGMAIADDTLYVPSLEGTDLAAFALGGDDSLLIPLPNLNPPYFGSDVAADSANSMLFIPSFSEQLWVVTVPDGAVVQTIDLEGFTGSAVVVSSTGLLYVGSYSGSVGSVQAVDRVIKVLAPEAYTLASAVTGAPGYQQVFVSWQSPYLQSSAFVDAPLRWYRATAMPGGGTCIAQAPATSCTIGGLSSSTAYTFSVETMYAGSAWGAQSAPSSAVTPLAPPRPGPTPTPPPPGQPRDLTAQPGDQRILVGWSSPLEASAQPVSLYRAIATPGGEKCLVEAPDASCVLRDLSNGTQYVVAVQAKNAGGWGPAATAGPVTPRGRTSPSIDLDPEGRTRVGASDIITASGTTTGIPRGARLTSYVRFSLDKPYRPGDAPIVVGRNGTFTWQRHVGKHRRVYAYMEYEDVASNRVLWMPIRS